MDMNEYSFMSQIYPPEVPPYEVILLGKEFVP